VRNHTFRGTGITANLENGGTLEKARQMAAHASTHTTQLYDRRENRVTLDEVAKINIHLHQPFGVPCWCLSSQLPSCFGAGRPQGGEARWRSFYERPRSQMGYARSTPVTAVQRLRLHHNFGRLCVRKRRSPARVSL